MMKNRNPMDDYPVDRLVVSQMLQEFAKQIELLTIRSTKNKLYLDSADIKLLLGISDSTLYRLRKQGAIEVIKIGKKLYTPLQFFINYQAKL